ncbi:MAG: GerMN domain-containing protein [Desulfuromonadales bacterium]|nr:GerMN domain-containing protein [Desulfuromonadales bacterium]
MPNSRNNRPPRRDHLILWAFLLILVVFGGLLLRHFLIAPAPPPPAELQRQLRTITLYFAAADGSGLVAEAREITDCLAEEDCLKATVQALLDGPVGNLAAVLPPQATLRGVMVAGSELQIDFDRTLIDAHPGGSWSEILTVQSLADTVAVNFPHLRQIRILVEGAAIETLKGHVDLRQPIAPDFTLVLTAPAGAPPTTPTERPK